MLAALLRPATGFDVPVVTDEGPRAGDIELVVADGEAPDGHGDEGYRLRAECSCICVGADNAAGIWNGVQTLRQLLPAAIESGQLLEDPLEVVAVEITDYPRFAYRSTMLDVARHFFSIEEVERYIDEISMLKINTLHLHLANDQGWGIEIEGWPLLTEIGGLYEVDAGPGGYYTQDEFRGIVDYAAARNVMIVPEANMPGTRTRCTDGVPRAHVQRRSRPSPTRSRQAEGVRSAPPASLRSRWPSTSSHSWRRLPPGPTCTSGATRSRATPRRNTCTSWG